MIRIFRGATRVLVWLGLDKKGYAEGAIEAINQITQVCYVTSQKSTKSLRGLDSLWDALPDEIPYVNLLAISSDLAQKKLQEFFSLPWFSRLWVIQEVKAGNEVLVLFGAFQIPWDNVSLAAGCIRCFQSGFHNKTTSLTDRTRYLRNRKTHKQQSMLSTFHKGRDFHVSVLADHIYGMLGMPALASIGRNIETRHAKEPQKLFRGVFRISVEHLGNLDALSYVQHQRGLSVKIPTFIPQWDELCCINPLVLENRAPWKAHRGSGVQITFRGDVIELRGACIDSINTPQSEDWAKVFIDHDIEDHPLLNFIRQNAWGGSKYVVMPNVLAYGRTLVAGSNGNFLGDKIDYSDPYCLSFLNYVIEIMKSAGESPDIYSDFEVEAKQSWHTYAAAARDVLWGRCVLTSKKGYIGCGRNPLQPGDKIRVLFGGRAPYILRPQKDFYQLIGETYLDGFMMGKAMDMLGEGILAEEVFEIH